MNNVSGKVVVITGASRGIGKATSVLLANRGAKIVLGARNEKDLIEVVNEIRVNGGEATYCVVDVTDKDEMSELVAGAISTFGKIDVIFNNAGYAEMSPISDYKIEDWQKMIEINLNGVLWGIKASLPYFIQQGYGHIINTASVAGINPIAGAGVYCATKAAVRALTDSLRLEVSGEIRTTLISPGAVKTDMLDKIRGTAGEKTHNFLNPEDVANSVLYAISQPINVDVSEVIIRPFLN